MAGLPHNISKSGFRRGEYVLHLNGAQRVVRCERGWRTAGLCSLAGGSIFASGRTLAELSANATKWATDAGLKI